MVAIVLINVFCHGHVLVNCSYTTVDIPDQLLIQNWWREKLEHLEDFNLEPRAWRHVVVIVLRVVFDAS